jgi:hypothetical protein
VLGWGEPPTPLQHRRTIYMDLAGVGGEDNWIRGHWALPVGEDGGVGEERRQGRGARVSPPAKETAMAARRNDAGRQK